MSRHQLAALRDGLDVAVGWDPGLCTYFVHVRDAAVAEGDPAGDVLWLGVRPCEVHDHEVVLARVRQYATVPPGLAFALYGEAHG